MHFGGLCWSRVALAIVRRLSQEIKRSRRSARLSKLAAARRGNTNPGAEVTIDIEGLGA